MNEFSLLNQYDFHDSLLEGINYDPDKKCVVLDIDFCKWKQDCYQEGDPETLPMCLILNQVSNVDIPDIIPNGDSILSLSVSQNGLFSLVALNDHEENVYTLDLYIESFDFVTKQNE